MECKTMISSGQAKMSNLSDELLEHEKELQAATNRVEELVSLLKHTHKYNSQFLLLFLMCIF